MQVYETAGESLQGTVDGVNRTFVTSLPFDADSVQVFINGLSKVAGLDCGYSLEAPNKVITKEAREVGDTVAVSYALAGQGALGGQLGGVPPAMGLEELSPSMFGDGEEQAPQGSTLSLQSPPLCQMVGVLPTMVLGDAAPSMLVDGQSQSPQSATLSLQSPPLWR